MPQTLAMDATMQNSMFSKTYWPCNYCIQGFIEKHLLHGDMNPSSVAEILAGGGGAPPPPPTFTEN
jgi:hypothetical protein